MRVQIADLAESEVTQYPYRTATVDNGAVTERVKYAHGDELESLSFALAAAVGVRPDNHVVYRVVLPSGEIQYVEFSDWRASFATAVIEQSR